MRITQDVVRRLSDYAGELTGGEFGRVQISNPGDGVRYTDGRLYTLGWSGGEGARKAAAYYAGVIDMAHPGTIGDRPRTIQGYIRFLTAWRESAVRAGAEDYNVWLQTRRTPTR